MVSRIAVRGLGGIVFAASLVLATDGKSDPAALLERARKAARAPGGTEEALKLTVEANRLWDERGAMSAEYLQSLLLELDLLHKAHLKDLRTEPDWSQVPSLSEKAMRIANGNDQITPEQRAIALDYLAEVEPDHKKAHKLSQQAMEIHRRDVERIPTPQVDPAPENTAAKRTVSVRELAAGQPAVNSTRERNGAERTSVVAILIGADGLVHKIRLVREAGFGLDERAADAISKWRFRPAMVNGRPVPKEAKIEVDFALP